MRDPHMKAKCDIAQGDLVTIDLASGEVRRVDGDRAVMQAGTPDAEGIYPDCSNRCDVRGGAIHAADCPHATPERSA